MARDALTGSRIRERRGMAGLKQSELARQIGISASYLNLIEHNRRRIGGKLLLDIASILEVEPSTLTEGAEAALIDELRVAADSVELDALEAERVEEFAGRFPGWARALVSAHARIASLERTVETLNDRLTYDPQLAASVHEVLSTAASIRATASILAEDSTLSPEWTERFHKNIDADSLRLAQSSKALVGLLDAESGEAAASGTPREEVEAFLAARGYVFQEIEDGAADLAAITADAPQLESRAAQRIAQGVLEQVALDSQHVPLDRLQAALGRRGLDPLGLAAEFEVSVPAVLRRLATLQGTGFGLVVADRAGSLLFRKPTEGFTMPRHGAACTLWPLFAAFAFPGQVTAQPVVMPGVDDIVFECFAAVEPGVQLGLNMAPLGQATMLIVPVRDGPRATPDRPVLEVGASCRICPRLGCVGRREPSILSDGFGRFDSDLKTKHSKVRAG